MTDFEKILQILHEKGEVIAELEILRELYEASEQAEGG
ncbi:hypothetical protein HRbin15_01393 [bacterium HR15]|nr:hypothetical protein HRbin15_01393 [bacterium HR15]